MSCRSGGCSSCEVSENRGCGVSTVFDWLYQIDGPKTENANLVEVQFKGDRKDFYLNTGGLDLKKGDIVAVEGAKSGHDIGKITIIGELVALQITRKKREEMVPAQRIGSAEDIAKVVMFLLSEDSSYIHGENIVVDGGVMNGVLANIGRD